MLLIVDATPSFSAVITHKTVACENYIPRYKLGASRLAGRNTSQCYFQECSSCHWHCQSPVQTGQALPTIKALAPHHLGFHLLLSEMKTWFPSFVTALKLWFQFVKSGPDVSLPRSCGLNTERQSGVMLSPCPK